MCQTCQAYQAYQTCPEVPGVSGVSGHVLYHVSYHPLITHLYSGDHDDRIFRLLMMLRVFSSRPFWS